MTTHTAVAVVLRRLQSTDFDSLHTMLSDWNVVRYMCLERSSRAASKQFLDDALDDAANPAWRSIVRAILDDSGSLVGICGIVILRGAEEGEIWYLLRPDCWGRGLATSAAMELLHLGFGELALHRMWASCLPENPASQRVLEKIGMRQEGYRRKNLKIHGKWKDSYEYAILREEWRKL